MGRNARGAALMAPPTAGGANRARRRPTFFRARRPMRWSSAAAESSVPRNHAGVRGGTWGRGGGGLAVEVCACAHEPIASIAAELHRDHGVVGAVADRHRQVRVPLPMIETAEALDLGKKPPSAMIPAGRGRPSAEPERVRHHIDFSCPEKPPEDPVRLWCEAVLAERGISRSQPATLRIRRGVASLDPDSRTARTAYQWAPPGGNDMRPAGGGAEQVRRSGIEDVEQGAKEVARRPRRWASVKERTEAHSRRADWRSLGERC